MNTALAILAHALRMLIHEPSTTLRVILPAILVVLGCSWAITMLAGDLVTSMQVGGDLQYIPTPNAVFSFLVFGLIGLMGYALMAILWHRHVLLNGADNRENLRPDRRIFLSYVWRAIVLGLVQIIASIPAALILGILAGASLTGDPSGATATVLTFALGIALVWIAMRLSLVLPAAALGHPMSLGQSWDETKPAAAALWGVALLLSGLDTCMYLITSNLLPDTGLTGVLVQTFVYMLEGLVFVSMLTTLYGHLVEGRSLGQ
ncbi:hypothetical protein HKX54_06700 [Sulfitobacter sp. M57]|uniref:hypothetical protein n=1 Tax=unclassified Sulfitobacter TaxID=196795 RepID=UPI0023E0AB73|nr:MULTISPECIES: hypothetical protein [unclassified Sulfitobacter]MDF3414138.1 hypothetical protein [Sulfitobacter sp. KE5]MDF3420581.1 hypothetical protein [Sulfitobacter sp. KE43]MDF3432684.1 hypothetical protein [Sulfitobacter sp. KE42]MDF3458323.1 hypothetical protein [Sulfitobacter sp. S74]MDF3462224.1 hypothetical protein [Sulfitobacter sp. Ks18]